MWFWELWLKGSIAKPEEAGNVADSQLQGSKPSQFGSQANDDKGFCLTNNGFFFCCEIFAFVINVRWLNSVVVLVI